MASWLSAGRASGKAYAVHFAIPDLEVEIIVLGRELDLRNAPFQVEDLLHMHHVSFWSSRLFPDQE
jgi:hypothetical protein